MRSRLAVDFGTSHTIAVVQRQDGPPRSLLFDGSPILPSSVCLGDDGVLHVGRDAQRMALVSPTRFEPHPKRRIDDGTVLLGDTEIPVVELFAGVLRRVADEARQAGLADPAAAGCTVLTCPADWGAARRAVLTQAAQQAGLGQVRLVDEPIAAATYCLAVEQGLVADGQPLVVFDFGGGTFDVALVRRERDAWRVLATGGLDDLGGVDIDAALVGHLGQLLELRDGAAWRRLASPDTPAELRDRHTFWTEVRAAKEMLSRVTTAPVQVPRTDDTLHLTREELERIAGPLVARAVDETRRVLQRAGVNPPALAGIFLVGGSSRLPLVATRLHARFGIAPSVPEQPELPVAHGALLATTIREPAAAPEPPSQTGAWPAPAPTGSFTTAPPPPPTAPVSAAPTSPAPTFPAPASSAPTSPAPASPASAMSEPPEPQPVPPPSFVPPPVYRPPARKTGSATRSRLWMVLTVATVAVVVLIATAGVGVFNGLRTLVNKTSQGANDVLGGTTVRTTGKLTTVKKLTAPNGASAVAGVATPAVGYYAVSEANKTQVTAQPTDGGKPWTVDLAMYPEDLELIVIGDLLVVDGESSVRHGGKDARAVVDTRTRRKLWEKAWEARWDVAYLGTDAVVELADGFDLALIRVDLRTGATKWSRPAGRDLIINGMHRGQASLSWPTDKTPAGPVAIPGDHVLGTHRGLQSHLHSGTEIVELVDNGKVAVLNGATGAPRVQRDGLLDIDQRMWTVYEGLLVAAARHNSQAVVVAYRLTDLKEVWRRPAPPGASIKSVAPCGPKLVCEVRDGTNGDRVIAINTTNGRDAWQRAATDDGMPVSSVGLVPGRDGLLVGGKTFNYLDGATLVDFAGKVKHTYDESYRLIAVDGKRIVSVDPEVNGWDLFVSTLDKARRSPAVRTSDSEGSPETVSLAGDTVVFTVDDDVKGVYVLKVSGLPAP